MQMKSEAGKLSPHNFLSIHLSMNLEALTFFMHTTISTIIYVVTKWRKCGTPTVHVFVDTTVCGLEF